MPDTLQKEKKKVFTFHLKQYVEKGEWKKLIKTLPVAEDAGVDSKLLLKSYLLLGKHFINKEPYSDATIFFSKARSISNDESTYLKLLVSLRLFYNHFESAFSKSDLQHLLSSLRFLHIKCSSLFPTNIVMLNEIKDIISTAQILEQTTAKDVQESPASFKVVQVCNSLYRPKTPQDVFERCSDLIMDSFQEFYDDEFNKDSESKKKKKKKKESKKNGDKKE